MADPTGSGPRSDRRVSGLEWTIIALGLGLALILLVGGLLPARERNRKIRQENEHLADEVLELDGEVRQQRERIDDRKLDPHTIGREMRDRGGRDPEEVPLPPERPAAPANRAQPSGTRAR